MINVPMSNPFGTPRGLPKFNLPEGSVRDRALIAKKGILDGIARKIKDTSDMFCSVASSFKEGKSSLQDVMKAFGEVAGALSSGEQMIKTQGNLPAQVVDLVWEQRSAMIDIAYQAAQKASDAAHDLQGQTSSMDAFLGVAQEKLGSLTEFYRSAAQDMRDELQYSAPAMRH